MLIAKATFRKKYFLQNECTLIDTNFLQVVANHILANIYLLRVALEDNSGEAQCFIAILMISTV